MAEGVTSFEFTAKDLKEKAKASVKGQKCPHGRRWELVDWKLIFRDGILSLSLDVQCPHEEDRRTAQFEVQIAPEVEVAEEVPVAEEAVAASA